jgi:hypothetical protein
MLKINKKLKKKKHKKGKDEELFTQEELEQYKKKLADKARLEEAAAQGASGSAPSETVEEIPDEDFDPRAVEEKPEGEKHENKDEWEKFKALTAGVDDILTSSKGKLEEIKKESFYQRKPPGPSEPDRKKPPPRPEAPKLPPRPPPPHTEEPSPEEIPQFPLPDESEEEDEDDIFDTAYIDAVASGQIKLAYIPDSPPPEPEDDPFDTSIVDKVIKPKEIITKDGKKKTLVSLGCAVDVLTGILDKEATRGVVQSGSIKKRRVQPRDLLLDGEGIIVPSEDLPYQPAPKTLLDEEAVDDLGEDFTPVPVSVVAVCPAKKDVKEETDIKEDNSHLLSLVAEFDVISSSPVEEQHIEEEDEEDDEFAALAAESLIKNADPFDTSAVDKVIGVEKRPPGSPDVDIILCACPEDPFDTTHAENLAPGKLELQIIESEILGEVRAQSDIEDDDFDPRADETKTSSVTIHVSEPTEPPREDFEFPDHLTEEQRDLLGGSSTDLANLVHDPIEPKLGEAEDEEVDPFDTSAVVALVPGKLELQILEQELLDEDEDFDPRARDDLLDENKLEVDIGVIAKPLTPQPEQEVPEEDPFDTSFAANLGPGKAELRFIESEFANSEVPQQSSFEPAACQPRQHQIVQRPDLLEVTESDDQAPHKPLTPALETAAQPLALPDDPFDTSQVGCFQFWCHFTLDDRKMQRQSNQTVKFKIQCLQKCFLA